MRKYQKGISLLEFILVLAGIAILLCVPNCTGCKPDYSAGRRSGVVVKFSRRGVKYKSYEGTLHLGNSLTAMGAATWDFSVADTPENEALVQKLDAAQNSGVGVQITYRQWYWSPMWLETAYEAQTVEEKK